MRIIGLTGRSGSGKSTVAAFYRSQGYPVADADQVARQVLEPGSACLPALVRRFGADILDEQGRGGVHLFLSDQRLFHQQQIHCI